jgi:hypothetical protein
MKVCYLGKTIVDKIYNDKIYDAIQFDKDNYCIRDDTGNKSIYSKNLFREIQILCKAKYIGKSCSFGCIYGHIYDIISNFDDYAYEIIDETNQSYMYQKFDFEIIPNNVNIMEK